MMAMRQRYYNRYDVITISEASFGLQSNLVAVSREKTRILTNSCRLILLAVTLYCLTSQVCYLYDNIA